MIYEDVDTDSGFLSAEAKRIIEAAKRQDVESGVVARIPASNQRQQYSKISFVVSNAD